MKQNTNLKPAIEPADDTLCNTCGAILGPEYLRMRCSVCGNEIGEDIRRAVLTETVEKVDWSDPDQPTIIIAELLGQYFYCSEEKALAVAANGHAEFGPYTEWAPMTPDASCISCGAPVKTEEWHQAVEMTVESGPRTPVNFLGWAHVARFCTDCEPLSASKETYDAADKYHLCLRSERLSQAE